MRSASMRVTAWCIMLIFCIFICIGGIFCCGDVDAEPISMPGIWDCCGDCCAGVAVGMRMSAKKIEARARGMTDSSPEDCVVACSAKDAEVHRARSGIRCEA